MPEVRVDPLTGLKTIVAEGERAIGAASPDALRPAPALSGDAAEPERHAQPDLFTATAARGAHELLSEQSLYELDAAQLADAVATWKARMREHAGAACRHLTVDGPYTQLYALDFVPAAVARERERFGAYAVRTMGGNLLADLVQEEVRQRTRIVAIDDEAVLMAPYASRSPYHLLLAPRRAAPRFEDDAASGAGLIADALRRLRARFDAPPPLTLWVRTQPSGAEHFSWRIELLPRVTPIGGLELGAGVPICTLSPERAAAELRAR